MTVTHTITLPDIGDYKDVPVIDLLVKPGDAIDVDTPLLIIESDKATIEVPSPMSGKVVELIVAVGAKVSHGTPLIVVEAESAAFAGSLKAPPTPPTAAQLTRTPAPPSVTPSPAFPPARQSLGGHATPSTRQYARELGVDLSLVVASGPKNRILREDVQAFVKRALSGGGAGSDIGAGLPPWPSVDFSKFGKIERKPLSRIQKLSGGNLARNWLKIPHVTNFDHADVSDLDEFRKETNASQREIGAKLTMVAFLIKASASALLKHPEFNSSLDSEDLVLKNYVHIGFAADTPNGLVVPVIRDCEKKSIFEIAVEMSELAEKARKGALLTADIQGGCFTVSSLGGVGGDGFTPIINAPEAAILGAGRASIQPVWDGVQFKPRLILPLSLSWDHRIVDGVAAARFLGHVAAALSDFRSALL